MTAARVASTVPTLSDPRFRRLRAEVVAGYLNAPDTMVAEVIDGNLSLLPRPRRLHARASVVLCGDLHGPFDRGRNGPGGWMFLAEPELHVGSLPDMVVPDLAGWRRERLPEEFMAPDAPAFIDLAPDWVCEVLSESTEAHDRGKKRRIYRRENIGHYWLVNPRDKSLEVYRLVENKWLEVDTFEGDVSVRAEPFEAIELDLSALWAP
jgi:Uma2 family endonuclease